MSSRRIAPALSESSSPSLDGSHTRVWVKQAREAHAQALAIWKLRCEEIAHANDLEQRAYEQRVRSHPVLERYNRDVAQHQQEVRAARATFEAKKADWAAKKARFDENKEDDLALLATLAEAAAQGDADSQAELVRLHLMASPYPATLPRDYSVRIDRESGIALIELVLPDFTQVSFHKLRELRSGTKAVDVGAREARSLYDKLIFGLVIRHLIEVVRVPVAHSLTSAALNGVIRRKNPATGKDEQFCALSVCASIETLALLDAAHLDRSRRSAT